MEPTKRRWADWQLAYQTLKKEVILGVPDEFSDLKIVNLPQHALGANFPERGVAVLDNISYFSDDAIKGILAHEIGHIHLKDHPSGKGEDSHLAADRIARGWGFRKEVDAFIHRYVEIHERLGWPPLSRARLGAAGLG